MIIKDDVTVAKFLSTSRKKPEPSVFSMQDPISVSKTASYIIEAVAVIPQLWIFSTLNPTHDV
jgi:hypothetical protein